MKPTIRKNDVDEAPPARYTAAVVTEEQVRLRAYRIFETRRREGIQGDAVTDWVRAEQELRRQNLAR